MVTSELEAKESVVCPQAATAYSRPLHNGALSHTPYANAQLYALPPNFGPLPSRPSRSRTLDALHRFLALHAYPHPNAPLTDLVPQRHQTTQDADANLWGRSR